MTKHAYLIISVLTLALAACGDNIRGPEADTDSQSDDCFEANCPNVDLPDAGMPTVDSGGGDLDAGTCTGQGCPTDGGTGGGADAGTDADTCGACPEGQVCVDGACVCDRGGVSDDACEADEVQFCHMPPRNPGEAHGICVGSAAVMAHQGHGDTLGACP